MYIVPLSLQPRHLMGVGGQGHAPADLPPGKTAYPLYRRLGGLQGRSGRVRKISPPPPTGIRSPDRPARSGALHRLRYPGPKGSGRGLNEAISRQLPGKTTENHNQFILLFNFSTTANLSHNISNNKLSQQSSSSPYTSWGVQKAAVTINHVGGCKTELRDVSRQNYYYSTLCSDPIRTQLLTAGFYDMPNFSLDRHSRLEPKEQQASVWVTNTVALTKRRPEWVLISSS